MTLPSICEEFASDGVLQHSDSPAAKMRRNRPGQLMLVRMTTEPARLPILIKMFKKEVEDKNSVFLSIPAGSWTPCIRRTHEIRRHEK